MTASLAGERPVVIGFGASGRAAARALLEEGARVRVSEARRLAEVAGDEGLPAWANERGGVELCAGGHLPEHLDGATLLVVSPGMRPDSPVVRWARERRIRVWGELELGARLCGVPFIAVTGTNGKTTTALLVAEAMREAGLRARACGNVGYPFSLAAREPLDALVVEASSFQLVFTERFRPKVSVLLNVAPDHLDWHGSFQAYAGAKARIYAAQREGDVHVGNRDDPEGARISANAPCRVRWFRPSEPPPGEVGVADGRVVARLEGERDLGRPVHPGHAFLADAAAASAAALEFGLPPEAVSRALTRFEPPPHRGQVVARAGSVRFIDDSKATNPHAALTSLEGRKDVVLIAGGLAKGVDLSPLATAAPRLVAVVVLGDAADAVEAVFEGLVPVRRARAMDEAAAVALRLAPPGGTVLLAPACASQDMFRDYRERGERFAAAARAASDRSTATRSSVFVEEGAGQG